MIKKAVFILIFLAVAVSKAQSADSLFTAANALYQQEKYAKALDLYKKIESLDIQSDALYYNMANANYKLNRIAPAIYYYEKALQLNPGNEDAEFNLGFAKRMALDNIEPLPKTFSQRIDESLVLKLSDNQWAWTGVVLLFSFAVLFLLYHFSYSTSRKRLYFITAGISVFLALLSLGFAYRNRSYQQANTYAIVFAQKADVKTAPTLTSEISFELHEGTKVKVLEKLDNWVKIKIADGKIGWMVADEIKDL